MMLKIRASSEPGFISDKEADEMVWYVEDSKEIYDENIIKL